MNQSKRATGPQDAYTSTYPTVGVFVNVLLHLLFSRYRLRVSSLRLGAFAFSRLRVRVLTFLGRLQQVIYS